MIFQTLQHTFNRFYHRHTYSTYNCKALLTVRAFAYRSRDKTNKLTSHEYMQMEFDLKDTLEPKCRQNKTINILVQNSIMRIVR